MATNMKLHGTSLSGLKNLLPVLFKRRLKSTGSGRDICISLGTMDFGRQLDAARAYDVTQAFLQLGYTDLDTAVMYGDSEKILGTFKECKDNTKVSLATKANPTLDLSRYGVVRQLDESLKRLGVSSVDLFYLHWPDHSIPIEETLAGVNQLHQDGKFKEFGLSNFKSWEVVEICRICTENGYILPTVYQGMYNAVTRVVEYELIPALRKYNMRFYAYNPLAAGLLTGKYQYDDMDSRRPEGRFFGKEGTFWFDTYLKRYWKKELFDGINKVQVTLDHHYGNQTVTIAEAALRWMHHHSALIPGDGIIVGVSKLPQLTPNVKAIEAGPLHDDIVAAFETAWQSVSGCVEQYFR